MQLSQIEIRFFCGLMGLPVTPLTPRPMIEEEKCAIREWFDVASEGNS